MQTPELTEREIWLIRIASFLIGVSLYASVMMIVLALSVGPLIIIYFLGVVWLGRKPHTFIWEICYRTYCHIRK
jgi:amino acid transporter